MKSEVNDTPKRQDTPYPKLRQYKGAKDSFIVLFIAPSKGTVVHTGPGSTHCPGDYGEYWAPGYFEDFHGSLTLSNN